MTARDYFNPFPGLEYGLRLGVQIAQQDRANDAMALAKQRQADEHAEAGLRRARQIQDAQRIQELQDAQELYRFQLQRSIGEETDAIPAEARTNPDEIRKANARAFQKTVGFLPPGVQPQAMQSIATQETIGNRADARHEDRLEELAMRLDSQEWIQQLREESRAAGRDGRKISEDEFVNRHLSQHAKRAGISTEEADMQLRSLYRRNHPGSGEAPVLEVEATEVKGSPADVLAQLERAKEAGIDYVKVTPGGEVVESGWWGGTDVDDAVEKYKKRVTISGGSKKPAAKKAGTRVFEYDPETGGIKQ